VSVVTGRDASLSDLVANSLGGWIGVELANQRAALLLPRAVGARRLAVAWALAFAAVCGLASAGLRPATIPRSLWVQWTPQRPGYGPFTGRLLAFDVDGIDLPLGFPAPALGVDRVLRGETWRATATIAADSLERRRSVIVRIAEEVTVLVSIEQSGWDLACLQKTRSADFRFRSPRVALEDAFSLADAETPSVMKLVCAREHAALVASTGGKREIMRFGPALGWLLVSPFDIAMTRSRWWMNALWLIGLTIPMGYWGGLAWESAAAGRRGRRAVVAAVGISLLCGLAVAPSVANVAVATAWEWAAAFAGVALGYGVSRVARRWRPDVS
jgi:hypothetical protein